MRALAILLLLATPVYAGDYGMADQGYLGRCNGMDLDDDFVYGEPGDDDTICDDADGDGDVIVAEDFDGDAVTEAQIYITDGGTDDSNCGGPDDEDGCATVAYAMANRLNTQAGEDVICLADRMNEAVLWGNIDGDAGTKARPALGWEVVDDYEYPSEPIVMMGADRDQDDCYPPFDADDLGGLEGGTPTDYPVAVTINYGLNTIDTDRVEFAHMTFSDFCTHTPITDHAENCGAFGSGNNLFTNPADHVYIHDLHLDGISKGHPQGSSVIWLMTHWGIEYTYLAIENILATEIAGYGMRGSGGQTNDYLRVRNVTADWYGCGYEGAPNECFNIVGHPTGASATFSKLWGPVDFVEYLNLDLDTNAEQWNGDDGEGVAFNTCVRNAWLRNSKFTDFQASAAPAGGSTGGCIQRYGDEINYDSNEYVLENAPYESVGVVAQWGGDSKDVYHRNATIINNIWVDKSDAYDYRYCFVVTNDSPSDGADPAAYTITFANNTCHSGDFDEVSSFYAFNIDTLGVGDQHHAYVVKNNIFAGGTSDDRLFGVEDTVASFDSDYNIFEDNGSDIAFNWGGQTYSTLALFSAASGTDANSKGDAQNACDVTFVASTDLHLDSADTCAQDASTSTGDGANAYTTIDFDGDNRPQNVLWDIGADEYESGYVPVGACCDSACEVTSDAACDLWQGAGTTCTPDPCETEPPITPVSGLAEGVTFSGVKKD